MATLQQQLLSLRENLAASAQRIYDDWEQDDQGLSEEFGSGGICDRVSDALAGVIYDQIENVDTQEGGQDGDDHSFLLVYDDTSAFIVDIPPGAYEQGGGYSWTKIEDVTLTPDHIIVEKVDRDWVEEDE